VSTASAIGDCLVVAGVVDYRPEISATYCLSCFPQHQCEGGNPARLTVDIEKNGISDQRCVDYSWCAKNNQCNGSSTKHFGENKSSLVPNCGCFFGGEKLVYYLDKGGSNVLFINNNLTIDAYRLAVKSHILDFGPVVGGYFVLTNFFSGDFCKYNGGVYLDRADYERYKGSGPLEFNDRATKAGAHAVAVIGWGVEKNIQVDFVNGKEVRADVPYWWCRNSWGTKWGDKGYFKIAMYPFNKRAQFDMLVDGMGAMFMFKATKPPKVEKLPQVADKYLRGERLRPDAFYQSRVEGGGGGDGGGEEKPKNEGVFCAIL
jgi:hypothetical protein